MPWKHKKNAYRLTIEIQDPDDESYTLTEDVLETDLNADDMTDFHAYYNWYGEYGWEIVQVEEIELWDWKDMRIGGKWRKFYELYGDGQELSIDYWNWQKFTRD